MCTQITGWQQKKISKPLEYDFALRLFTVLIDYARLHIYYI